MKNKITPQEKKVVKDNHHTTSKGCFSQGQQHVLTDLEQEVFFLLTREFLTPNQIRIRRRCSQQAISKIITSLRKKGYLKKNHLEVVNSGWPPQPSDKKQLLVTHQVRLHGLEFNINILYKDEHYKKVLARTNILYVDGNTIKLYNDAVEVYALNSFFGDDATAATSKAMSYFQKFFIKLENQLKVILVKPNSQNIRVVKSEYAEVANEYAKECNQTGQRLKVYAREDGKLWFEIDNSFQLHEAETKHPVTAKPDMDKVKDVFNDIRDKQPPLISELANALNLLAQAQINTTAQLQTSNVQLQTLIKVLTPKVSEDKQEEVLKERPHYIG